MKFISFLLYLIIFIQGSDNKICNFFNFSLLFNGKFYLFQVPVELDNAVSFQGFFDYVDKLLVNEVGIRYTRWHANKMSFQFQFFTRLISAHQHHVISLLYHKCRVDSFRTFPNTFDLFFQKSQQVLKKWFQGVNLSEKEVSFLSTLHCMFHSLPRVYS